MKKQNGFNTKARLFALLLAVLLFVCILPSCDKKPQLSEVYNRVCELVEKSYDINALLYGEGIPTISREDEYSVINHIYYGYSSAYDDYEMASSECPYVTLEDMKNAIAEVYCTSYCEILFTYAFEGNTIETEEEVIVVGGRYLDDGTRIWASTSKSFVMSTTRRIFDYSTMEIVSPSNSEICYVKMTSWTKADRSDMEETTLRLVYENGNWYLDTLTV